MTRFKMRLLLLLQLAFDGIELFELWAVAVGIVLLPLTAIECRCAIFVRSAVSSGEQTLSYVSFFNWLLLMVTLLVFWPLLFTMLFNGESVDFFGFSYLPLLVSFSLFFLLIKLSRLFCSKENNKENDVNFHKPKLERNMQI